MKALNTLLPSCHLTGVEINKSACKFLNEWGNCDVINESIFNYNDRLFKTDFAGELLDKYSDLKLDDYGFLYHRDYYLQKDDLTWFLLEKS